MTLSQFLPRWLVRRWTQPPRCRVVCPQMKRRQILPTLPRVEKTLAEK